MKQSQIHNNYFNRVCKYVYYYLLTFKDIAYQHMLNEVYRKQIIWFGFGREVLSQKITGLNTTGKSLTNTIE